MKRLDLIGEHAFDISSLLLGNSNSLTSAAAAAGEEEEEEKKEEEEVKLNLVAFSRRTCSL